jgi:hypothetical protein
MQPGGQEERMILTLRLRIERVMIIKCVESVIEDILCLAGIFKISEESLWLGLTLSARCL